MGSLVLGHADHERTHPGADLLEELLLGGSPGPVVGVALELVDHGLHLTGQVCTGIGGGLGVDLLGVAGDGDDDALPEHVIDDDATVVAEVAEFAQVTMGLEGGRAGERGAHRELGLALGVLDVEQLFGILSGKPRRIEAVHVGIEGEDHPRLPPIAIFRSVDRNADAQKGLAVGALAGKVVPEPREDSLAEFDPVVRVGVGELGHLAGAAVTLRDVGGVDEGGVSGRHHEDMTSFLVGSDIARSGRIGTIIAQITNKINSFVRLRLVMQ